MKTKLFYAGLISLAVALLFGVLGFTRIEFLYDRPFLTNIQIYPVFLFLLAGLVLIYRGLKQSS